jgi:hypothetical protein
MQLQLTETKKIVAKEPFWVEPNAPQLLTLYVSVLQVQLLIYSSYVNCRQALLKQEFSFFLLILFCLL